MPDTAFDQISGINQQIYQRLKLALELNLRRQIFLAVCDDLTLRNRLAAQLHEELAYPSQQQSANPSSRDSSSSTPVTQHYPRLVSLQLNLSDPNPIVQVAQWLAQYPPPRMGTRRSPVPGFQILGIEHLTRQSATAQRLFFNHLQGIERGIPVLESSLLLWMPRPWFRSIQQTVPEFWCWRTGVFEFVGDPTPTPATLGKRKVAKQQSSGVALPSTSRAKTGSGSFSPKSTADPAMASSKASPTSKSVEPASTTSKDDLWNILSGDLAKLDQESLDDSLLQSEVKSDLEQAEKILLPGQADSTQSIDDKIKDSSGDPSAPLRSQPQNLYAQRNGADFPSGESEQQPAPPLLLSFDNAVDSDSSTTSIDLNEDVADGGVGGPIDANSASALGATFPQRAFKLSNEILPLAQTIKSPLTQSRSAAELADLILATTTQELQERAASEGRVNSRFNMNLEMRKFQPLQILQQIEQLHLQHSPANAIAAAYRSLGNFYRDRIEQGDISEQNLVIAIQSYEEALTWLDENAALLPDVLNDTGNLYWMLSRRSSLPNQALAYLQRSLQSYQAALVKTDSQAHPHTYAMIQNNIGAAYGDMARHQNPAENLQKSVQAYQEALQYRQADTEPLRFASTQNNLGTAYWNLAQHQQPVVHLKQAIAAYKNALQYYNPEQEPLNYAMIQNNLGTTYWNLAQYEHPTDLLMLAIGAYQVALMYRTLEVVPAAYAATQNNLGTAYWHLANQAQETPDLRLEYLQQAIAAYDAALKAATQLLNGHRAAPLTFDVFATHNNLGLAHNQVATDQRNGLTKPARRTHLETALHHHLQALEGWQQQPDFYQTALSYVIQTVRIFYTEYSLDGQNFALSKVPGPLLPKILPQL